MGSQPKTRKELKAEEVDGPGAQELPERAAMSLINTDAAAGLTILSDESTAVPDAGQGGLDDEAA